MSFSDGLPASVTPPSLPPQRRGRERRAQIVAAAADLIDEAGAAGRQAVTVRAIAAAARTRPASIYHYFADVDSLFAAVAARYSAELTAAVDAALAEGGGAPQSLFTSMVAAYRREFATRPGLRELWFDRRASEQVVEVHREYRSALARRLRTVFAPFARGRQDLLDYTMLVELSGALWELAFQLDAQGDERVVDEIVEMGMRYLRRRIGVDVGVRRPLRRGDDGGSADLRVDRPVPPAAPPQARGRERRAQVLTAAAAVIDDHGGWAAEVSIRSIAAAAGVWPNSIYHYFPDLDALKAAVAEQYMEELLAVPRASEVGVGAAALEDLVAQNVGAYRVFFARRPGLRDLWFDRRGPEQVRLVHERYRRLLAARNRETFARHLEDPGALLTHVMYIEAVSALWAMAFALDPDGDHRVLGEIEAFGRDFVRRMRAG